MKKLLLIAAAMLFVLPMAVMADPIERDTYLSNDDLGAIPPGGPGWEGPYAPGPIDPAWDVAAGADVYVGIENEHYWVNMKTITITIATAGAVALDFVSATADGVPANHGEPVIDPPGTWTIEIFPQPDWEVLVFNNSGGAGTITSITIVSECELVPSMTNYGLGILALLLIGSTVWVLRRRRVGSVA